MKKELRKTLDNRVLVIANSGFAIMNFRKNLLKKLVLFGFQVHVLTPKDEYTIEIAKLGVKHHEMNFSSTNTKIFKEIFLLAKVLRFLLILKPDLVLSFTIKPNLYGAICSRLLGLKIIPNVTGLGAGFQSKGFLRFIIERSISVAFKNCRTIFFQNPENLSYFVSEGLIKNYQAKLLPGSGVDLKHFNFKEMPDDGKGIIFILISRLIWDKGIKEYCEAAKLISKKYKNATFNLLGGLSEPTSGRLKKSDLDDIQKNFPINYLGSVMDVRPYLKSAHCVVLPSYYNEGTPRVLLEAGATGRVVITTDTPGCRDTVINKKTGFLCKSKDSQDLALNFEKFINLSSSKKRLMGYKSRKYIEERFSEDCVISAYTNVVL